MQLPLEDVKVLDLSHALAGPFCSTMLADYGAQVIKIEPPGPGDIARAWGSQMPGGETAYFVSLHRNKKGIVVDLKHPQGRELFLRMVERCDVVLENYRVGALARLGVDYATARQRNPGIIYCSISGFGQDGPYRERAALDLILQAESGMISVTGEPGSGGARAGVSIADLTAGMNAAYGIMLALRVKERTGQGQSIDVSMMEGQLALLGTMIGSYLASGEVPAPMGTAYKALLPYQTFRTRTRDLALAVGSEKLWKIFCPLIGCPELAADERYRSNGARDANRDSLIARLQEVFLTRSYEEWEALLVERGIPVGTVNTIDEVVKHPQVRARGSLVDMDHPRVGKVPVVGVPVRLSATPGSVRTPSPALGQHTDEVLRDLLGLGKSEIDALRADLVIANGGGREMYAGKYATTRAHRPAFIMAGSGEAVTYAQYEARSNRLAHLLRAHGLKRLDHYAVFMENNSRYLECCGAGERAGLYYTCVNSYLTADELAYIVNNSASRVLITSRAKLDVAAAAAKQCPNLTLLLVAGGEGDAGPFVSLEAAAARFPETPIADEQLGTPMLYSSGTTGRPKGILRPLPENLPSQPLPLFDFLRQLWRYRDGMTYLSPAPLYHSAPQAAVGIAIRHGATVVIMERFDPEAYLDLVEKYRVTHSQLVPTMFSRMLKLPEAARRRHDLSSLEIAIHAAAPCPVQVKEQMIEWWGPIIHEYYGATEGLGFTACDSAEWLAHRGSVGKVLLGDLHVLDHDMQPCPAGTPGTIWFKTASPFEYFNDPEKTAAARSADGSMSTVGDVGYVDADRFLYLTDRATFMIISGGVNIYPQECENLLITHPKVADAAVFGVPNADLGEEVKAVVQAMPGVEPGLELERELLAFCGEHLAHFKCPRSVDFEAELPRLPTGKLYKRILRDRYWGNRESRIV